MPSNSFWNWCVISPSTVLQAKLTPWATILTPIVRPVIAEPVPLALIDKPAMGTGATRWRMLLPLSRPGALREQCPPRKVMKKCGRPSRQHSIWVYLLF